MSSLDDTLSRLNQPMQKIQVNVGNTPVLTCQITGKSRFTNKKYLEQKAESSPGETLSDKVKNFKASYVCKEAAKLLRQGVSVGETREILGVSGDIGMISEDQVSEMLKLNGSRDKLKPIQDPDIPWYDGDL